MDIVYGVLMIAGNYFDNAQGVVIAKMIANLKTVVHSIPISLSTQTPTQHAEMQDWKKLSATTLSKPLSPVLSQSVIFSTTSNNDLEFPRPEFRLGIPEQDRLN